MSRFQFTNPARTKKRPSIRGYVEENLHTPRTFSSALFVLNWVLLIVLFITGYLLSRQVSYLKNPDIQTIPAISYWTPIAIFFWGTAFLWFASSMIFSKLMKWVQLRKTSCPKCQTSLFPLICSPRWKLTLSEQYKYCPGCGEAFDATIEYEPLSTKNMKD